MVSMAIPPLTSFIWPPAFNFSDAFSKNFEALITLYHQISTYFWSDAAVSVTSFMLYSAGTFVAITVPAWLLLYSTQMKKITKPLIPVADFGDEVNGDSSVGLIVCPISGDALSQRTVGNTLGTADAPYRDELTFHDAKYAEEMQFHEALMASIFPSELNSPSSSIQQPIHDMELLKFSNEAENSSQSFCGICLEDKESWQMFTNDRCSHAFCFDCTRSHIVAKIQDKLKDITCMGLNCKATMNPDTCRLIIPDDTLVQWDEILCMSLIPESQKLYCPFRDCSAMLVNDSRELLRNINCLICKRPFCAECRVPWHSDFTCKEFQKLYAKRGGKDDKIIKTLAKKKSWQKCPKCKMYVEKTEGCLHITCRCKYEFCYRCGSKWSESHGSCRPKS